MIVKNLKSALTGKYLPVAVFGLLVALFALFLQITGRPPEISSISPKIGSSGDTMVISGRNFGLERGKVSISGIMPTVSAYREWTDRRITVGIPDDAHSGLVHVVTKNGRSQGYLFTNRDDIPATRSAKPDVKTPRIEALEPARGKVGSLLTITGMNFGANRDEGKVYFSWTVVEGAAADGSESQYIAASPMDFDYEFWSEKEIQVRVPEGASTGNVFVKTARGKSNSSYFELIQSAGTKLYKNKATYNISSSVDVGNLSGGDGAELYLWIPRVLDSSSQRNVQLLKQEPPAQIENYNGLMLVKLENLNRQRSYRVNQTYILDRYGIETRLQPDKLPPKYDETRSLYRMYTARSLFVPAEEEKIVQLARKVAGREPNPYRSAQKIYDYVRQQLVFKPENRQTAALKGLEERGGDSFTYSSLFVALLRSLGIPSRTISGFLVAADRTAVRHFWSEFYLEEFGWLPVDVALGDGAAVRNFEFPPDPAGYYFGSIDNRHISFSRGTSQVKKLTPYGKTTGLADSPSLQTIYAEAAGGLENYTASWNNLVVVGIY